MESMVVMRRRRTTRTVVSLTTLAISLALTGSTAAAEAADFFRQNCMSCHTIGGGRLVGPDLKDVMQRKNREWLIKYIVDPQAMIDSGDPYVAKLVLEARGTVMPKVPGINRERAEALLMLIAAESKLEKSHFMGVQISMEPFTDQDVQAGRAYFIGLRRFKKGAPSCYSCHAVKGIGTLGGGRLGPDLTRIFERLEGRKNLAAWLSGPATSTMQPIFRQESLEPEEVRALVAFFEATARGGQEAGMRGPLGFLLLGLGGAIAGLVLMDAVWKNRFRAVRRCLVARSKIGHLVQGEQEL